jgi:hypothetical protein
MDDDRVSNDARQALLWARASGRRLAAATAMDDRDGEAHALDRYGEWLQGLQALHSAIAAVRSVRHRRPSTPPPVEPDVLADLHERVGEVRRIAATGVKRLGDAPAAPLRPSDRALVAVDARREIRITFAEWQGALDAIETWAEGVIEP